MEHVASLDPAPQAALAGLHLEPDVPTLAPVLTDGDPSGAPDRAPPLRRAGLANILLPIRERKAAGMADADPSEC
jgi:hypothetical protein